MKCAACHQPMTVIFHGQTRHPCCHPCQTPTSTCPDCIAERRAHRAHVARRRAAALTKRLEQA